MKDAQGMPRTCGGLGLRIAQFAFALVSLSVMGSTNDFPSVTAFRHLVAAVGLQCLWSLLMALIDVYAILVRRSLRNCRIVSLFVVGDGITSNLTFAAACASAGITVLISNDLDRCALNHCARFESATAMAFVSWFARTHVISSEFLVDGFLVNIPRRKQNLHPHLVQHPLTLEKYVTTRLLAMLTLLTCV